MWRPTLASSHEMPLAYGGLPATARDAARTADHGVGGVEGVEAAEGVDGVEFADGVNGLEAAEGVEGVERLLRGLGRELSAQLARCPPTHVLLAQAQQLPPAFSAACLSPPACHSSAWRAAAVAGATVPPPGKGAEGDLAARAAAAAGAAAWPLALLAQWPELLAAAPMLRLAGSRSEACLCELGTRMVPAMGPRQLCALMEALVAGGRGRNADHFSSGSRSLGPHFHERQPLDAPQRLMVAEVDGGAAGGRAGACDAKQPLLELLAAVQAQASVGFRVCCHTSM
eukprot:87144-Chlamydomonas_euryale.AAC.1